MYLQYIKTSNGIKLQKPRFILERKHVNMFVLKEMDT